ncbi:MAG: sigma-54-dependent transcriptional regulator [Planctomycetaceae bacterium]
MSHVLIVDDEPAICWSFEQFLTDDGNSVSVAASAEDGLDLAGRKTPDAIVLDVRLPGMDGLTAIREFQRRCGDVPIVVITAHGNLETAVQAVQEGAFDYLPKPFDLERAADVVRRALARNANRRSPAISKSRASSEESLLGESPVMQDVFKQIALVAASDVPVLLTGESGTGKEMVARAIHRHSHRRERPFVPVCLAALSAGLVESELFGHVKGAFTGATQNRTGLLELADGGTVLLDEIAETDPGLQVKLLRALEQREITPVGDPRPRGVNVRIIAATNQSMPEVIRAGRFREDLYFRLSVFRIHLPPLRERPEDVPVLAKHFLQLTRPGQPADDLAADVLAELQSRRWPGNVRELRNAIEHAAVLARGEAIRPEHLPPPEVPLTAAATPPGDDLAERIAAWVVAQLERESSDEDRRDLYEQFLATCEPPLMQAVLSRCNDQKSRAADLLGMHRTTLRQRLRKYGLDGEYRSRILRHVAEEHVAADNQTAQTPHPENQRGNR